MSPIDDSNAVWCFKFQSTLGLAGARQWELMKIRQGSMTLIAKDTWFAVNWPIQNSCQLNSWNEQFPITEHSEQATYEILKINFTFKNVRQPSLHPRNVAHSIFKQRSRAGRGAGATSLQAIMGMKHITRHSLQAKVKTMSYLGSTARASKGGVGRPLAWSHISLGSLPSCRRSRPHADCYSGP